MFIKILPSGPFETNAYILACEKTRQAIIIDPGVDSFESVTSAVDNNDLQVTAIFLTHSHWDHIADVSKLKKHFDVKVMIHKEDEQNLMDPGSDGLPMWITFEGVKPDVYLEENDTIKVGDSTFVVIHTPGHTPGGVCLYSSEENILISGDTLFKQSIGNLSFPTANPEKMWDSLKKLEVLPPRTIVYPGHGPKTTIGEETWLPRAKEFFGG